MRAVNLLPRDEAKRSFAAKRGVVFGAAGGAALVTVVFAALILGAGGAIGEQQSQLDSLNAELAALPQTPATEQAHDAELASEKTARVSALSAALAGRTAWDRVLRQISQVLPEDVWLTSLGSSAAPAPGTPAAAAAPAAAVAGVTLNGSTYSQDGVARFLARLAVVPALTNVRLQASTVQVEGSQKTVQFTILADLRAAGAAS